MRIKRKLSICLFLVSTLLFAGGQTTHLTRDAKFRIKVDKNNTVSYYGVDLKFKHDDPPNIIGYCEKVFQYGLTMRVQPSGDPTGQFGPAPGDSRYKLRYTNRIGSGDKGFCTFDTTFKVPFIEGMKDDKKFLKLCNEGGLITAPPGYEAPNRRYENRQINLFGHEPDGKYHTLMGYQYKIVGVTWRNTNLTNPAYQYDSGAEPGMFLECEKIPCGEKLTMFPVDTAFGGYTGHVNEPADALPDATMGTPYRYRIFSGGTAPVKTSISMTDGFSSEDHAALKQFTITPDGYLQGTPTKIGSANRKGFMQFIISLQDSCVYNLENKDTPARDLYKKRRYSLRILEKSAK